MNPCCPAAFPQTRRARLKNAWRSGPGCAPACTASSTHSKRPWPTDSDAHAAEERVREELRQLGQEVLVRRANEAAARAQAQVRTRHPHASQPGKKKFLKWQTTFGWIAVEETQ